MGYKWIFCLKGYSGRFQFNFHVTMYKVPTGNEHIIDDS